MRTQTQSVKATKPAYPIRKHSRLSADEHAMLSQHPFSRIAGTALSAHNQTELPPLPERHAAWDQGALLGLRMLDAAAECERSTETPWHIAPYSLINAIFQNQDTAEGVSRARGFCRVLEMVLGHYVQEHHHGADALQVIGLETAWREWAGVVPS